MTAYAVKHVVGINGYLSTIMKHVKKNPYSYTSKRIKAAQAAIGNDFYVIEVRRVKAETTYWLGYKHRADLQITLAGGGFWKGKFKFKNMKTSASLAAGAYFDTPVRIDDLALNNWLRSPRQGMTEIPASLVPALELLLSNPTNGAKYF